jgi:hypothetical protein
LRTDARIVKRKLAMGIGLRVCDRLHPALQLNEDYLNSWSGFSSGAVLYSALQSASRCVSSANKGESDEYQDFSANRHH